MSVCDSPGLLPIEEALEKQLAQITPITEIEEVPLSMAAGRIVATDIVSSMNVPPADNSAMDGYALISADANTPCSIVGQALAGHPFEGTLSAGQAVRIMTGAPVPQGADAVIMQEQTDFQDGKLVCSRVPERGDNIRRAGEDIKTGAVVVPAGQRLAAQHLSLLASVGIEKVKVFRQLRIAVLATGDELVAPGTALADGQIYESNRIGIIAILQKLGCEVVDLGIIADDLEQTRTAFTQAAKQCDWIISSGGVSVGDADYVKQVIDELGDIDFWKVAIKPGKPYAFGRIGDALFAGLPGNPVSSFVTLIQLVVPCLSYMAGETATAALPVKARLTKSIKRRAGRTEFLRARAWQDEKGDLCVQPQPRQGSGIMNSFTQANCFLIMDADCSQLVEGDMVSIQVFNELLK